MRRTMNPLEQIQQIREQLERLTAQACRDTPDAAPALQERMAQVRAELAKAEQQIAAVKPRPQLSAAETRAQIEQRVAGKMQRAREIKELKAKHGARWV